MTTITPPAPASETQQAATPPAGETSLISRIVALGTPVFVVAAGWVAGLVAQAVPGAHLDQTELVAFMITAATAALTAAWKWLAGWQQHELRVAQGIEQPVGKPKAGS